MAYLVGSQEKGKSSDMETLAAPNSFMNIKQQLLNQQQKEAPRQVQAANQAQQEQKEVKLKKRKFQTGGVVGEEEEEEETVDTVQPLVSGPSTSATIGAPTPTAPTATTSEGSGAFTNIRQYIEANKPKTAQMAGAITKGVETEAGQLGTQLGQQREKYIGQEGLYGDKATETIQSSIAEAGRQPDQDTSAFRSYATGKAGTADLTKQQMQAQDLARQAKEFETSRGRQEQLQKMVGKTGGYTGGQQSLDRMLLAGDRESKLRALQGIRSATAGLGERVSGLGTDIEARRTAVQQQAQEELGQARTGEQERLTGQYERLRGGLEAGQLSAEDLSRLGLEAGQRTYGTDLSGVLEGTKGTTQEDIARLDALAQLGGLSGREQFQGVAGGDVAADIAARVGERRGAYEQAIADPTRQLEALRGAYEGSQERAKALYKQDQAYRMSENRISHLSPTGRLEQALASPDPRYSRYILEKQGASPAVMEQFDALSKIEDPAQRKQMARTLAMYGKAKGSGQHTYDALLSPEIQRQIGALYDPYQRQISGIESAYGGTIGQTPQSAQDGGVITKDQRLKALMNIRGR